MSYRTTSCRATITLVLIAATTMPGLAQDSQPETVAEVLRPVRLETVVERSRWPERRFFGEVVARETVDLAFQVSGQIVDFPAVEGARVEAGGLIAELDLEPFEIALGQAELRSEQADRTLGRAQQLGPGTVSQASIDDAETEAGMAGLDVRNARYELDRATLNAPVDALIAARNVAVFTSVNAGEPVVRLHDMSELRVEIAVPEVLFRSVQDSDVFDIYALVTGSDVQYPLETREFEAQTSAVGQSYTITLAMTDVVDERVLPGASVTVVAQRESADTAVFIPPTAVVINPDESTHVMVFEPTGADEGTVRAVPVTIEASDDGQLRLIDGPEPGAEIVSAGAAQLADGQAVRRFANFGN